MKNPWLKKNPVLSMWLSGANAVAGAARGRAGAVGKRQAAAATGQAVRQITDFWSGAGLTTPAAPRRRKRRSA